MKLIEVLNAKEPLTRLISLRFTSFKKVRELVKLSKEVDSEVEFYVSEEKKIIERYAVKAKDGTPELLEGGKIKLKSLEDKNDFEKEILDLRNTDIEISTVELIDSDFKDTDNIPTPQDIILLSCLVEFKEE